MNFIYIISEHTCTGKEDIAYTTSHQKAFEYLDCLYSANDCLFRGYLPGKYESDKKWFYMKGFEWGTFPKEFFRDNMLKMTFIIKSTSYSVRKEALL